MGKYNDERLNFSGMRDSTAYSAIQNIRRDERKNLITKLKQFAKNNGYRIIGTIKLKELDGDDYGK